MTTEKKTFFSILIASILFTLLYYYTSEKFNKNVLFTNFNLKNFNVFKFATSNQTAVDNYLNVFYLNSSCDCKKDKNIAIYKYETYYVVKMYNQEKASAKVLYNLTKAEFDDSNFTCDLYSVLRRGKSQKVLGFSLYGKNRFYYDKIKNITQQMKELYPGWLMRVHYDQSINKSTICEIECQQNETDGSYLDNSDFCNINDINLKLSYLENSSRIDLKLNANYMHSMKWRWLPIGDSFVDIFSSRDSDSYIIQREIDSVNVWLNSDKLGHIMRGELYFGLSFIVLF